MRGDAQSHVTTWRVLALGTAGQMVRRRNADPGCKPGNAIHHLLAPLEFDDVSERPMRGALEVSRGAMRLEVEGQVRVAVRLVRHRGW
jgi:hypothetical protein